MENIIMQVVAKTQEAVMKKIHDRGLSDIGAISEELLGILKSGVCELLSGILEETDREIADSRAMRKADGLKVKERGVE